MKRFIQMTALFFVVAFTATGCAAQRTADASVMLQDEERKEQIFSAILNDKEMRTEFMKRMMAQNNGSGMMKQMMQTAESDTATCKMMSSNMMENPHMMDMMMGAMMDKAEEDDAMCQKMCKMMMDSDKMKGMMQQMNGQGRPSDSSKAKGNSHINSHLKDKHTPTNKDK